MRLVLLGPPGAGKGTQAKQLAHRLEVPAISTGDIFRSNVADGTELGLAAQQYLDSGEYVPDEVTTAMVGDRLAAEDARDGFLLDGYPRTAEQVSSLDGILSGTGAMLDRVVELSVARETLISRLAHRAEVEQRSDDTVAVIAHRMDVYLAQTAPLVDTYTRRGILVTVDGVGEVDVVTDRMLAALTGQL